MIQNFQNLQSPKSGQSKKKFMGDIILTEEQEVLFRNMMDEARDFTEGKLEGLENFAFCCSKNRALAVSELSAITG